MVPQEVRLDEEVPVLARPFEVGDQMVVDGALARIECRDELIDLFGGRFNDDWDGMSPRSVRSTNATPLASFRQPVRKNG